MKTPAQNLKIKSAYSRRHTHTHPLMAANKYRRTTPMQSTHNHEAEQQPTRPGSITVSTINDRGEKIREKGHVTETRKESRYHEGKQEAIYSFSGAESHREVCVIETF